MTHPTHTNDNTPRPDWYDRQLVDYLPFARKCANRFAALYGDDADEIVQDFYVEACNRWASYDAENYRFGTLVYLTTRSAANDRMTRKRAKMRTGLETSMDADRMGPNGDDYVCGSWLPSAPATQAGYVELSEVLRWLSTTKNGALLVRHAMGEEQTDLATERGVSRQRMEQIMRQERARLRKAVG